MSHQECKRADPKIGTRPVSSGLVFVINTVFRASCLPCTNYLASSRNGNIKSNM